MNTMEMVPKAEAKVVPLAAHPMALIETALASGASAETLERLMALQERWQANEAQKAYGVAMAAAQTEMRPVSADASNPQTRSKYASYHALDGALRPVYTKNGFSLSFDTADGAPEGCIRIVCHVTHNDGHRTSPHLDMPADGKGAKGGDVMTKTHATGAAVTYGRRYLLGMIFNIAVGDDTDGNTRQTLIEGSNPITPDEFIFIRDLIEKLGAVEQKVLASVKASSLETMTQKQYRDATARLQSWAKTKAQNGTT